MVAPDSRLLKPRNINRLVLLLAFLAPLVYLFGTQFFALAGAHGEEVFAEPVYVYQYVDVEQPVGGDTYKFVPTVTKEVFRTLTDGSYSYPINCNGVDYSYFDINRSPSSSSVQLRGIRNGTPTTLFQCPLSVSFQPVTNLVFILPDEVGFLFDSWFTGQWSVLMSVPSSTVVESPSAYTSYLFDNMFGKDNFLADLGRESLKDNPKGFAPYGSLIKFLDDTVFHMSGNSLALMGYGYVYYCGHVVLLDLIAMILLFIPRIIAMVLEFVTKGVDTR